MKAQTMALGVALCMCGCAVLFDTMMPEHPDYVATRNTLFVLKDDVYVLDWVDHRGHPMISPFDRKLTAERIKNNIGRTIRDEVILAFVPKGTRFRVVGLRCTHNFEMGDQLWFDLSFEGEIGKKWPLINSGYIAKFMPGNEPWPGRIHLRPDLVEEVK